MSANYFNEKFKVKKKIDQAGIDFINSIEFHRENAVEADLFYRFFSC